LKRDSSLLTSFQTLYSISDYRVVWMVQKLQLLQSLGNKDRRWDDQTWTQTMIVTTIKQYQKSILAATKNQIYFYINTSKI